jgi:site-specific DNA-methyltransferase (adenine-specific)
MNLKNPLYEALGVANATRKEIIFLSKELDCSIKELDYLDSNCILPSTQLLEQIQTKLGVSKLEIMLKMGIYDLELKKMLSLLPIEQVNAQAIKNEDHKENHELKYNSDFGQLYQGDCISLLNSIEDETFDVVFADPPFNLNKLYPSGMDDNISHLEYIDWCQKWIDGCIRTLKPGGSLFLWNIPKWNTYFSEYLNQRLNFRHWIATDVKFSLPIQSKLYPSHYSLLYYIKGEKPKTYHADRLPMETCPKCYGDIKDYGGYKDKMNPKGVNMSDVWYDIPPVRHAKYKGRSGANELSIKLLDRVIEMSSDPGDHIFDPFGGSGTTYIVAEMKKRKWTGVELGPIDDITKRFANIQNETEYLEKLRKGYNKLFLDKVKAKRVEKGIWTDDTFRIEKSA